MIGAALGLLVLLWSVWLISTVREVRRDPVGDGLPDRGLRAVMLPTTGCTAIALAILVVWLVTRSTP